MEGNEREHETDGDGEQRLGERIERPGNGLGVDGKLEDLMGVMQWGCDQSKGTDEQREDDHRNETNPELQGDKAQSPPGRGRIEVAREGRPRGVAHADVVSRSDGDRE